MSQQNIVDKSIQINSSVAAVNFLTDAVGDPVPADIDKLIIANTSSTATMVTISDGVNNYYYSLAGNSTIVDGVILPSDRASTGWTAQCSVSVNSIYISAIVN